MPRNKKPADAEAPAETTAEVVASNGKPSEPVPLTQAHGHERVIFDMLDRTYKASCESVNTYVAETPGGQRQEYCKLKLRIIGIEPADMVGSRLFEGCFTPQQGSDDSKAPPDRDSDQYRKWCREHFSPIGLEKGIRRDMDAGYKLSIAGLSGPLMGRPQMLRPIEGVTLQEMVHSKEVDGCIDLVIIAKGVPVGLAGLGWRISIFNVNFLAKSQEECNEDAALKPSKRKKSDDDDEEEEDNGPGLFDGLGVKDTIAVADCSPESLDRLPAGHLAIGPDGSSTSDTWRKAGGDGACWLNPSGKTATSEELIDYAGSYVIFSFTPDSPDAEVPEWIAEAGLVKEAAG